jgi:hypothetical protein
MRLRAVTVVATAFRGVLWITCVSSLILFFMLVCVSALQEPTMSDREREYRFGMIVWVFVPGAVSALTLIAWDTWRSRRDKKGGS